MSSCRCGVSSRRRPLRNWRWRLKKSWSRKSRSCPTRRRRAWRKTPNWHRSGHDQSNRYQSGGAMAKQATKRNASSIFNPSGRTCDRLACERKWRKQAPRKVAPDFQHTMGAPENYADRLIDSQRDSDACWLTDPRESDLSRNAALPSATTAAEAQWALPPGQMELVGNAIHVWRAGLDSLASELPDFAGLLSASERKRAERFQFDRDRVRFI